MTAGRKTYPVAAMNRRGIFLPFRYLAVFLAGVTAIPALVFYLSHRTAAEKGVAALVEATSRYRPVEGRLAGGFRAGKFITEEDSGNIDEAELEQARDHVLETPSKGQEAYAQLALGKLKLLEGEIKEAKGEIETALAAMPESAEARNDLGVVLLASGNLEDALESFEQALATSPQMPEARFNRALCYERLQLSDAARNEYGLIAKTEPDNSWRDEIIKRQEELSHPFAEMPDRAAIVKAFESALAQNETTAARRLIGDNFELFISYTSRLLRMAAKAVNEGDAQARDLGLTEVETIGNLMLDVKGDRYFLDAAQYFRNLPDQKQRDVCRLITEFSDYALAIKPKNSLETVAAIERTQSLFRGFRDQGNYIYQIQAGAFLSRMKYEAGQFSSSLKDQIENLATIANHQWPYYEAWFTSQTGASYSRLGLDSTAIKYNEKSRDLFHQMNEPAQEGKNLQYIGNCYVQLGNLDSALSNFRKATILLRMGLPRPEELAYNELTTAEIYRLHGNHSLALMFANQALSSAEQANSDYRASEVLSFLGVEQQEEGQSDNAQESLRRAFEYLSRLGEGQNLYARRVVPTRAGDIATLRGDYQEAINLYNKAHEVTVQSEGDAVLSIDTLRGRARAYAAMGNPTEARSDLESAIKLIEDYRDRIEQSRERSNFLAATQAVFDQLILLEINDKERAREAFNRSEQSRARSLLDEISLNPLSLADVQRYLPNDLTLVEYAVTDRRTYIFLITREGFDVFSSDATTEVLDRQVSEYLFDMRDQAPTSQLSKEARRLYDHLIKPVEEHLSGGKRLCIVADKSLHFLPFGALVDEAGSYLIESYSLSYAPSATVLANCLREGRHKPAKGSERILAVGNPAFNPKAFPGLPSLPDAAKEASVAASFYQPASTNSDKHLLLGVNATKRNVLEAMKDCEVIHLATHCLVEERSPWLAGLVMADPYAVAPAEDESYDQTRGAVGSASLPFEEGLLQLREIQGINLSRTRLVVLSSCRSGLGQYYRGEGIVSLVRPFLAASVPAVVASLWQVDSKATSELMIAFHNERKTGNERPGDALRAAQLFMLRDSKFKHPYYWAPFISIGSST